MLEAVEIEVPIVDCGISLDHRTATIMAPISHGDLQRADVDHPGSIDDGRAKLAGVRRRPDRL